MRLAHLVAARLVRVGRPEPLLPIGSYALRLLKIRRRVCRQVSLLNCILHALKEIDNLILDKVLIDFHLALKVPHLSLVDELEDA